MEQREQSENVDRTLRRQYETALTRALKINRCYGCRPVRQFLDGSEFDNSNVKQLFMRIFLSAVASTNLNKTHKRHIGYNGLSYAHHCRYATFHLAGGHIQAQWVRPV